MRFDFTNNRTIPFQPFDRISATPYSLQNHAQQAVPSMHDFTNVQSIAHAPPLQRVSANPSAINAKNIVRGQYDRFTRNVTSILRAL